MRRRTSATQATAWALATVLIAPTALAGQRAPRTPDGRPDLQGIWDFRTATPLERPSELGGKAFFTEREAALFEKEAAERIGARQTVHPTFWLDYGSRVLGNRRTSLIVDPPDGRVPALTPAGQQRAASRAAQRERLAGPEDFSLSERCLVFSAGPPLLPGPYNNNLQIVQTPAAVVLITEMIHDARIVPLDGRPHLPERVKPWLGDPRGRWDGDTLVIETTNFSDRTTFRGSDERLRLVERLTRPDAETLRYAFTVDNPTAFAKPWTGEILMTRSAEPMYEFACHEGNYGMRNMLSGARYSQQEIR